MAAGTRYGIDPARIVHETIDGETIVIDLETGIYFSLTGSGADVWRLLCDGWSEEEIAGACSAPFPALAQLVAQLVAAGLISVRADVKRGKAAPPAGPWEAPALRTYTDMEYFLLLDPVHDVQAAGWPHATPDDRVQVD